jgi:hypothetical protein
VFSLELPLAFAPFPVAVLELVVPLALALVPQATLPGLPVAVAPAPVTGSAPVVLPPHTNCACACGVPSASTSVSAVPAEEAKDKRMRLMSAPS